MKELTPYELWQIDRFGNILEPVTGTEDEEFENGYEMAQRESEWVFINEERQLLEYE